MRYAVWNLPRLGQSTPVAIPAKPLDPVPSMALNFSIVGLGIGLSVVGYYNRKTDLGAMGMGVGSSVTGAGVVLLVMQIAGVKSISQV